VTEDRKQESATPELLGARRADILAKFAAAGQLEVDGLLSGFFRQLFERKGAIGSCFWEYVYLCQHADSEGFVTRGMETIARAVGKSIPGVRKSLKQLRSAGVLSWEREDGRPNRYRLK
jgi:hypothetical protein